METGDPLTTWSIAAPNTTRTRLISDQRRRPRRLGYTDVVFGSELPIRPRTHDRDFAALAALDDEGAVPGIGGSRRGVDELALHQPFDRRTLRRRLLHAPDT